MPIENPEKDPSRAMPKDLSIYIFHQQTELMKKINMIKNKSMKLDSLIIKENYKLKEISKELDLLKHKWKNNPKKGPIKKLHESLPLCHKFGYLTKKPYRHGCVKKSNASFL